MEFKKITNKNLWDVVNLQVKANQNTYIATNTVSLLEAYATQNENERVETFEGEKIYLSYVPGNDWAEKLYKEAGFVPNGEKDGEEIVLVLDLSGEK